MTQNVDVDTIVVGGGIVGLLSALRLRLAGQRVALLERQRLGAGSSTSNHGIIHSGGLYAVLHPELVPLCQSALSLFRRYHDDAMACREKTWYVGDKARTDEYTEAWSDTGIAFEPVNDDEIRKVFRPEAADKQVVHRVQDRIVQPTLVLQRLASRCEALGVEIHSDVSVRGIVVQRGKATGVAIGLHETVRANDVLLCAGTGLPALLADVAPASAAKLRMRVDFLLAVPSGERPLHHPVFSLGFGEVNAAPTVDDLVLVSQFGARQPTPTEAGPWPIAITETSRAIEQLRSMFVDGTFDLELPVSAHSCAKIEVSRGRADAWDVEPYPAVLDHGRDDDLVGLWSAVPGKFTFGFHASREAAANILRQDVDLALPELDAQPPAGGPHVTAPPWQRVRHEPGA